MWFRVVTVLLIAPPHGGVGRGGSGPVRLGDR